MPTRTIPTVTKLTAECTDQPWDFGHAQRINVLDPTSPKHFPCHLTGSDAGLLISHGTEFVGIPWSVLRPIFESANPKLIPTEPPKPAEIKPHVNAAVAEANKLPPA